jgi:hypothetical protein
MKGTYPPYGTERASMRGTVHLITPQGSPTSTRVSGHAEFLSAGLTLFSADHPCKGWHKRLADTASYIKMRWCPHPASGHSASARSPRSGGVG